MIYCAAHARGAEFIFSHTFSIRKTIVLLGKGMGKKLSSVPYTISGRERLGLKENVKILILCML